MKGDSSGFMTFAGDFSAPLDGRLRQGLGRPVAERSSAGQVLTLFAGVKPFDGTWFAV
jgi:hypothetical protein